MTPEFLAVAANYVELGKVAFYQDVEIWENKEPAPQPLLCAGDGPILQSARLVCAVLSPCAARGLHRIAAE